MESERIVAALLAGGKSRRMGVAKAHVSLRDKAMISHVAAAVVGDTSRLAVIGDASAAQLLGVDALSDPESQAGQGPLVGVLTALEWAASNRAGWLVVAPCDTPLLPHDITRRLFSAAADVDACCACVATAAGLEPLISLWRTDLDDALRFLIAGGEHPAAHVVLDELGAARLRLADDHEAMNVNSPSDLGRAEKWLAERL